MATITPKSPVRGPMRGGPEDGMSALAFARKAIFWALPLFFFLVSDSFYLRTYDSAQVKITLVQMGGISLLALWLCLLVEEGFKAFRREDMGTLAPFLAFMGSGVFSFLHTPYPGPSIDDFIRRLAYMAVALIVVREFTESAVHRLTRWILITTAVADLYGFVQWIDTRFFPPGIDKGIDPFIWRGAFGIRVFSSFGNPNFFANFLVITFPILLCQALRRKSWAYAPLIFLHLLNLYATDTKGSWIGFTVSSCIFVLLYAVFFIGGDLRRVLLRAGAIVAGMLLVFGSIIGYYTKKRMQSVNFRIATWLSTWEMIETHPFIGTGIGSFKVIYPAYRRPVIFHIEGKSNTETDHAEDEWLESLFDEGILGFGIFLWLIFSTTYIGLKAIGQLTSVLTLKGGRPPPRAYDILGYLIAMLGMLAHNSFDVSMRFVSSGVYLGLLSGLVVNLAHGFPLSHVMEKPQPRAAEDFTDWKTDLLWVLRLGAWAALGWAVWTYWREFMELQGSLEAMRYGGEILQWWIAWGLFAACVLGMSGVFAVLVFKSERALVALLVAGLVLPLNLFWGYFKADVYHNMAIAHSKGQQWDHALRYYLKVAALNPNFIMTNYFKGNVFTDRFDTRKLSNPDWGDPEGVARDDFERAEAAYDQVLKMAPNYVQSHHQRGVLYFKRGDLAMKNGDSEGAMRYWQEAVRQFRKYQKLDPVFPQNYYRLAHVHQLRKEHDLAIAVLQEYLEAKACVTHRHDTLENPVAPEALTLLGNAYLIKGDLQGAERSYKKALELKPDFAGAQQSLSYLYQRAKDLNLLKQIPAETPDGHPTFELIQSRH